MFKHHSSNLALFDIKLNSPHRDLVLLRGNEFELESVPFEGSVKLSIPEDTHVKKIRLSLMGEFNVEYFAKSAAGQVIDQVFDKQCVLKVEWNNLLTSPEGKIIFGSYGDTYANIYKLDHMKKPKSKNGSELDLAELGKSSASPPPERPSFLRANTQPHLNKNASASKIHLPKSGIDGTPFENIQTSAHSSFLLPKGNYNLPFKVLLPTNIAESVEGLPTASVLYKMQCSIEKGRFEKSIHTQKMIRIVRTLHPQNLNLIDSIDLTNTWPDKVQYNVTLPKKGVAIGSTIPIIFTIIPIAKGLSLKGITGSVVQHYHVNSNEGTSPEWELIVGKQHMHVPNSESLPLDRWDIKAHFKVPDNLKSINQTCVLKNNMIQVKHRLRLSIQLRNKSGHVSELRANLPIYVYISANTGHVIGRHYDVDPKLGHCMLDRSKEDYLFKKDKLDHNGTHSGAVSPGVRSANHSNQDSGESDDDNDLDREEDAPPLYQKHIFDKIYDLNSPQSPMEQLRIQSAGNSPIHSAAGSMVNIDSYFDIPKSRFEEDEGTTTLAKSVPKSFSPPLKSPTLDVLCKVPSYNDALDNDDDNAQDEPAPFYEGSNQLKLPVSSSISALDLTSRGPGLKSIRSSSHLFGRSSGSASPITNNSETDLVRLGTNSSLASSSDSSGHKHLHIPHFKSKKRK